jgi:predicted nucleic acid-binding protein
MYRRMSELLVAYASIRLQAVDAAVIALAERLDLREVATLDRRDFHDCRAAPSPMRLAPRPAP